jgi:YebC/PmpR family DNA-binding regulatory protein
MSGHSHWSGIKHKKAVADAKRGQIFTKLGHAIAVAAREGGGNPEFNAALRLAIEKAKEFNMPKDKIENSVRKGTGEGAQNRLEEAQYEALGPFGTMLIIKVITDNKNRTVSELRRILEKHGGKMADGGVSWNFKRVGAEYVPQYSITLETKEQEKYQKLLADLSDQPDVQEFYDNLH